MEARYHKLRKVTDKSVTLRPKKDLLTKRKSLSNNLRYLSDKRRDIPPLTPLHRLKRFKAIRDKNLKSKLPIKHFIKMDSANEMNGEVSDKPSQEVDLVCPLKTKASQERLKPEINGQNGFSSSKESVSNGHHNGIGNGHAEVEESQEVTANVTEEVLKSTKDIEEEEEEVDVEEVINEKSDEKEDDIKKEGTDFIKETDDTDSIKEKENTDFNIENEDTDFIEEKGGDTDFIEEKEDTDFIEEKEDSDFIEDKQDSDLRKGKEKSVESDRGSSSSSSTFVSNKEFLQSSEEMLETIQVNDEKHRFSISDEECEEVDVERNRISSTESKKVSVASSHLKEEISEDREIKTKREAPPPSRIPRSISSLSSGSYKTAYGGSAIISGRRAVVVPGRGRKRKQDEEDSVKERGSPSQPSPRWRFFHSSVTKLWSPSARDLFPSNSTPLRTSNDSMTVNLNEESINAHLNDPDLFSQTRNAPPATKKPRWGCIVM